MDDAANFLASFYRMSIEDAREIVAEMEDRASLEQLIAPRPLPPSPEVAE